MENQNEKVFSEVEQLRTIRRTQAFLIETLEKRVDALTEQLAEKDNEISQLKMHNHKLQTSVYDATVVTASSEGRGAKFEDEVYEEDTTTADIRGSLKLAFKTGAWGTTAAAEQQLFAQEIGNAFARANPEKSPVQRLVHHPPDVLSLSAADYFLVPMILWDPVKLFGVVSASCPRCSSGRMVAQSWNPSGPRIAYTHSGIVLILSRRFSCKACNHTVVSTDDELLKQWPEVVRESFPFLDSGQRFVERSLVASWLHLYSTTNVSAETLAETYDSICASDLLRRATRFLQRCGKYESYSRNWKRKSDPSQPKLHFLSQTVKMEIEKVRKLLKEGSVHFKGPSKDFVDDALQKFAAVLAPAQDRAMQERTSTAFLRGDHSFKLASQMMVKGCRSFHSQYTVSGDYDLILGAVFTKDEHIETLRPFHEELGTRHSKISQKPVCYYVDKCCEFRRLIRETFGDLALQVLQDLMHLENRLNRVLPKNVAEAKAFYFQFTSAFWRRNRVDDRRPLSKVPPVDRRIPPPKELSQALTNVMEKYKSCSWMSEKIWHECELILQHCSQGCVSDPVGVEMCWMDSEKKSHTFRSTSVLENYHRLLAKVRKSCAYGPAAGALIGRNTTFVYNVKRFALAVGRSVVFATLGAVDIVMLLDLRNALRSLHVIEYESLFDKVYLPSITWDGKPPRLFWADYTPNAVHQPLKYESVESHLAPLFGGLPVKVAKADCLNFDVFEQRPSNPERTHLPALNFASVYEARDETLITAITEGARIYLEREEVTDEDEDEPQDIIDLLIGTLTEHYESLLMINFAVNHNDLRDVRRIQHSTVDDRLVLSVVRMWQLFATHFQCCVALVRESRVVTIVQPLIHIPTQRDDDTVEQRKEPFIPFVIVGDVSAAPVIMPAGQSLAITSEPVVLTLPFKVEPERNLSSQVALPNKLPPSTASGGVLASQPYATPSNTNKINPAKNERDRWTPYESNFFLQRVHLCLSSTESTRKKKNGGTERIQSFNVGKIYKMWEDERRHNSALRARTRENLQRRWGSFKRTVGLKEALEKAEKLAKDLFQTPLDVDYTALFREDCREKRLRGGSDGGSDIDRDDTNNDGRTPADTNNDGRTPADTNNDGRTPADTNNAGHTPADTNNAGHTPADTNNAGHTPADAKAVDDFLIVDVDAYCATFDPETLKDPTKFIDGKKETWETFTRHYCIPCEFIPTAAYLFFLPLFAQDRWVIFDPFQTDQLTKHDDEGNIVATKKANISLDNVSHAVFFFLHHKHYVLFHVDFEHEQIHHYDSLEEYYEEEKFLVAGILWRLFFESAAANIIKCESSIQEDKSQDCFFFSLNNLYSIIFGAQGFLTRDKVRKASECSLDLFSP